MDNLRKYLVICCNYSIFSQELCPISRIVIEKIVTHMKITSIYKTLSMPKNPELRFTTRDSYCCRFEPITFKVNAHEDHARKLFQSQELSHNFLFYNIYQIFKLLAG